MNSCLLPLPPHLSKAVERELIHLCSNSIALICGAAEGFNWLKRMRKHLSYLLSSCNCAEEILAWPFHLGPITPAGCEKRQWLPSLPLLASMLHRKQHAAPALASMSEAPAHTWPASQQVFAEGCEVGIGYNELHALSYFAAGQHEELPSLLKSRCLKDISYLAVDPA